MTSNYNATRVSTDENKKIPAIVSLSHQLITSNMALMVQSCKRAEILGLNLKM